MTSTFGTIIEFYIENESRRKLLYGIPLVLVACTDYTPDWVYWADFERANRN